VTVADGLKAAAALFVAAIMQVSIFADVHVLGGVPDLLLVTLVAVALLRGAVVGAAGGFFAGLIVDTATLGQLGLTSLVLTLAGYWIGRYGETTGRAATRAPEQASRVLGAASTSGRLRAHAPFFSIAVVTILYAYGVLIVHFMLGERAPAGPVTRGLLPTILLNLILTAPVYGLVRRLLRPVERAELAAEVQLLG
jgi:cell shape-determining protein MreD